MYGYFSSSGWVNPLWFSTVALVLVLLGRVVDGWRCDCWDGLIITLETIPKTWLSHFQKRLHFKCKMPMKQIFVFQIKTSYWRLLVKPLIKTNEASSEVSHRFVTFVEMFGARSACSSRDADDHRSLVSKDANGDGWNKWKVMETERGTLRVAMATTGDGIPLL